MLENVRYELKIQTISVKRTVSIKRTVWKIFIIALLNILYDLNMKTIRNRESVAGSVIQASGTVEFEDGLRTGVLPGGCWCPCGGRT